MPRRCVPEECARDHASTATRIATTTRPSMDASRILLPMCRTVARADRRAAPTTWQHNHAREALASARARRALETATETSDPMVVRLTSHRVRTWEGRENLPRSIGPELTHSLTHSCASDVLSCGGCGVVCSTNRISQVCTNGACSGTCVPPWLDCNNNKQVDGCEINSFSDVSTFSLASFGS